MPSTYVHTEVEGRKLKLSNLEKTIYKEDGITKAEVVQYFLSIAPYILPHIKGRPLTLIRFPDGVGAGKAPFYAKSKPSWTPEWIDSNGISHSEETIDYLVPQDVATVVWLGNLAALELHPMQMTTDQLDYPDHFIFDLDPPEKGDFEVVKEIALALRDFLETQGYNTFVKTSGSKGLHIYVPILKTYTHEEMMEAVRGLAKLFINQNKSTCTLAMNKEKRGTKTLIDIFRNHKTHTTVSAYSLRGKKGAPISFPVTWDKVPDLVSSKDIHIRNYKEYLDTYGDVWADFYEKATPLLSLADAPSQVSPEVEAKLKNYLAKRNFDNTPEPGLIPMPTSGNQFCIQLHDAQNLHYDLRLEHQGVLLSWAIPKGLPSEKGVKRMAIRTEDHPMKYLTFEGVIPKGQYGAGSMWVWVQGTFEFLEQTEKKYKFRLKAKGYNRTYKMYRTKDSQWLMELYEDHDDKKISFPIRPMLAGMSKHLPEGAKYVYEIKWDGIRTIIRLTTEQVTIYSRSGRDITIQFPELQDRKHFDVEDGIFDGEIVSLDEQGRPMFSNVISRMHTQGAQSIQNVMKRYPVVCYLYDCLQIDGRIIMDEPLVKRQAWLNAAIRKGTPYRMSEAIKDGAGLHAATRQMEMEGIMAKDKNAGYHLGQRSDVWLKVKHRTTEECLIAGYTKGEGDRSALFGALHLLRADEKGALKYMGKVGTGFDAEKMRFLLNKFEPHIIEVKPFDTKTDDDRNTIWLTPVLVCEVQYASLASSGVYREPVFQRLVEGEL